MFGSIAGASNACAPKVGAATAGAGAPKAGAVNAGARLVVRGPVLGGESSLRTSGFWFAGLSLGVS